MNWYKKASLWEEIEKYGPPKGMSAKPHLFEPSHSYSPKIDSNNIREEFKEFIEYLKQEGNSEESIEKILNDPLLLSFHKRNFFTRNYSWSIPSKTAINEIINFVGNDAVLEIASGHGIWAKLLQESNVNVKPTDYISSPKRKDHISNKAYDIDIEDLSANDAIQKYKNFNVLMMSWPPYAEPMAHQALKNFNGNKLIFIGEGEGGCTGDDNFFKELNQNWNLIKEVDIPQWPYIHDYLYLYNRK